MATFTDAGETAPTTAPTDSPPGGGGIKRGRGRPPKGLQSPTALPGNDADLSHAAVTGDVDGIDERTHRAPPSAYELRRHPDTYPRRADGLPVPLYRVTRTEDDLHNYLAAMRPEDWGHCEMYVYQYYPRHRPVEGQPAYIDKISQGPVDLTRIIEQYGSGVYGFTLNDANVQGNKRTAMYAKLELARDEHPERYELDRLWIEHKDNKQLVARLVRDGVLNRQGERVDNQQGLAQTVDKLTNTVIELSKERARTPPPAAADPNAAAMSAIHQKSLDMMGAANKAAIEAATASNKSGGIAETLQLVTAIAGLVGRGDTKSDDTGTKLLLEELKSSREDARAQRDAAEKERQRNHELQMAALTAKQQQTDPLAQVKAVMEIKNLFGGGGGESMAPRNWKEQAIGMLGEHLPQILEVGGALVRSIGAPNPVTPGMVGGGAGNPQPAQLPPVGGQVVEQPPQGQQPAQPQAPTPVDDPTVTPEQRTQMERIANLQTQLQQQGRFLVNAIAKGQDGYTFAESLINMTDDLTYQRARAYTQQEWMTAIFSFPQLQQQFAGVEHTVDRFVFEFLDYGNPDGEEPQATEPAPAAPAPVPDPPAPAPAAATRPTTKGKAKG